MIQFAHSETSIGLSLEWLTICSKNIALVAVKKIAPQNTSEAKFTDIDISTKRVSTLKGKPPNSLIVTRMWQTSARPGEPNSAPELNDQMLVFLDSSNKLEYAINLNMPKTHGIEVAVTAAFKVLKSKDDILFSVRKYLKSKTSFKGTCLLSSRSIDTQKGFKRVQIPTGTEAYDVFYSGSLSYLIIPDTLLP